MFPTGRFSAGSRSRKSALDSGGARAILPGMSKSTFPKIIAVTFEQQSNPEDSFFVVHEQAADAANLGSKVEVAIYERKEIGVVTAREHYERKA